MTDGKARIAIITSRFNPEVTQGLRNGALSYLAEKDISPESISEFEAPGAFEIPLIAKAIAKTQAYSGVICLGCVIKGETAHFEYISHCAATGILQASLECEIPISFGVLTTYTDEQALERSRDNAENKGREAAAACLETLLTLKQIQNQPKGIRS